MRDEPNYHIKSLKALRASLLDLHLHFHFSFFFSSVLKFLQREGALGLIPPKGGRNPRVIFPILIFIKIFFN